VVIVCPATVMAGRPELCWPAGGVGSGVGKVIGWPFTRMLLSVAEGFSAMV